MAVRRSNFRAINTFSYVDICYADVELLVDGERPLGEETGLAHGRQPNTCG